MATKYNIHPDFARFPVITLRFSALIIGLINFVMKVQRWLTKRSFSLDTRKYAVASADGAIATTVQLPGDRERIRQFSTITLLDLLRRVLLES